MLRCSKKDTTKFSPGKQQRTKYFEMRWLYCFLFCRSITGAIRRWLKTQAAAKMGATINDVPSGNLPN
ncbi:hypothetical protein [Ferruginibacter sp.]